VPYIEAAIHGERNRGGITYAGRIETAVRSDPSRLFSGNMKAIEQGTLHAGYGRARLFVPTFVSILCLPSHAFADVPVPSLFGVGAPFFLSLRSVGLVFIGIVLIEASVFHAVLRFDWRKCILASLVANLVSSIVGLLMSGFPAFIMLLFIVSPFLIGGLIRRKVLPWPKAFLLGLTPPLCIFAWIFLTWPDGRAVRWWALYGSLVPAFLLSALVEFPILARWLFTKDLLKCTFLANFASYAMLAVLMVLLSFAPKDNPILTYDYLYLSAESLARSGKASESVEALEMMRTLTDDYDSFYLTRELKIAKILAEKGFVKEAKVILDRVKGTPREKPEWDGEIEKDIAELEKLLSAARNGNP
jgi:hypothetical protein